MDAAALSRSLLEESGVEADLTRMARVYLQKARALLLERHRAGAGGREIVSAYTVVVDYLIRRLFQVASQDYIQRYPSLNPRCALIAQGGYGRGELNPYSDIDLLFLYAWKVTPYVESVAEKVLYSLWDAGLEVGHATRSIAESMRLANKDMKVKTALIDARCLCGDAALYADFAKAVEQQLLKKNEDRFVREKLEENRLRRERYGGSVYLLEPDVKEGEGGLRDIHTALWISKVRHPVKELDGLVDHGVIQAKDLAELKAAQDFLLRVRNELHFGAGKHQDQLTFEEQERVSRALGFEGERKLKAVEVFMRSYYLHASAVSRIASLVLHRVTEHGDGLDRKKYGVGRKIREGVYVSKNYLQISDPSILTSQPENLISIFAEIQKHKVGIGEDVRELIRNHLALIDEKLRRSVTANLSFFEILKWKERVYETLVEMHRCGVLGAFIPEFGRLLCMVLHDLYHIYTVDQHSLRLAAELEQLREGAFRETFPLLTQLAREIENVEILYLALLFHDIGKGYGGGHSEIGAEMARGIARRMRLNIDDAAQLEFLVRHHLLMAHTAFRRDLEDDKTIIDFARAMGNGSNLKMLYLLTYADIRAVGPQVWNNWKAALLEDLYLQASGILEKEDKGEFRREDRRSRCRRIRARLRRRFSAKYGAEKLQRFLETLPDRYFLATPEDEIPAHLELMDQFSVDGSINSPSRGESRDGSINSPSRAGTREGFVSSVRHFPEREYSEMAICAEDRPGLFARITGVFAASGLDILNARITTSSDGLILDVFRISHAGRAALIMDPQKWERVGALLDKVLTGAVDVARVVEESGRPSLFKRRGPKVPTAIQIDNEASDDFTVVEVYTQDRIGVLFQITYGMHQLGISIHLAKISTNVDQVADVFYVADEQGGKIRDRQRLETIRQTLYQSLVSEEVEEIPA
ncbi:MAG: [protein-PII] uridylyltransferase [Deltaproteobacteria bacterium]|nr:[protein-PII] uridylyltransferase [Deltaproteobacteria bacterium]